MKDDEEIVDAFASFRAARERYLKGDYEEAQRLINRYRESVDYRKLLEFDHREDQSASVSMIVVTLNPGKHLVNCIESILSQADDDYELILVDNGANKARAIELTGFPLAYITPPMNMLPSEGRNIGAYFARGEYLAFVDDDAVVESTYVGEIKKAFNSFRFAAIRGRILPKTTVVGNEFVGHYDMGEYPVPANLVTEGNLSIRSDVFHFLKGFNPLVFGAEGIELTHRCRKAFPELGIYYWPGLLIRHDFARGNSLIEKMRRHAQTRRYLGSVAPSALTLEKRYARWYRKFPGTELKVDDRELVTKAAVYLRGLCLKVQMMFGSSRT